MIDPRAVIDPTAVIGADVEIGPWSVIGAGVVLERNCRVAPHVCIHGPARVGTDNHFFEFVAVGGRPAGEAIDACEVRIGHDNVFREGATVFAGTTVGDRVLVMPHVHVGAGCDVGDDVILGAHAALHAGVRVGPCAAVAALSAVSGTVPDYLEVRGNPARPVGIAAASVAGCGVPDVVRNALERVYQALFRDDRSIDQVRADFEDLVVAHDEVRTFLEGVTAALDHRH